MFKPEDLPESARRAAEELAGCDDFDGAVSAFAEVTQSHRRNHPRPGERGAAEAARRFQKGTR